MLETRDIQSLGHGPMPAAPDNGAELAEGLLLIRACTMKMVRFRLAMEREDRAVALEAMDDLVALDKRIGSFLDAMPSGGDDLVAIKREVEVQRSALLREKFCLAAGVRRSEPSSAAHPDRIRPQQFQPTDQPLEKTLAEQLQFILDLPEHVEQAPTSHRSVLRPVLVAAVVLALIALAVAATALAGVELPFSQLLYGVRS